MYQGRPIGPAGFAIANGMPRSDVPYATIPIVTSAPPTYVNTIAPGKLPLGPPPQSMFIIPQKTKLGVYRNNPFCMSVCLSVCLFT